MTNSNAPNPPDYTYDLDELLRAYRGYLGLSQRAMADRLGIREDSYRRIELGTAACFPGLIDRLNAIVEEFLADVDKVVKMAELTADKPIELDVSEDVKDQWQRAVIGRAAVECGLIIPILVGDVAQQRQDQSERREARFAGKSKA